MAGRDKNSQHFNVWGSGKKPYTVTINYKQGHWCSCRGMISKKSTYGDDAGRTQGTCCKHIKQIIESEFSGDWGTRKSDGSRVPQKTNRFFDFDTKGPSGRRAAVMATKVKREQRQQEQTKAAEVRASSIMDRIAALEAAREEV